MESHVEPAMARKPRRYLDFGGPAYWVVDPEKGAVWIWGRGTDPDDPRRETETVRWTFPEGADEGLELTVTELVAPLF